MCQRKHSRVTFCCSSLPEVCDCLQLMVCPSQEKEANIQIFSGPWNCWSCNYCHSGMVTNEDVLTRHKWLVCWWQQVTRDSVGPCEWQREYQFKGGSGHFSRLEHLGLDQFTSIKTYPDVFRLRTRNCYESEMRHLKYWSCGAIDSDLLRVPRRAN